MASKSRVEDFEYLKAKHPEMSDEGIYAFIDEKKHTHVHVKAYIAVFVALGILTIVTVAASYLEVPFRVAIFLGLLIASVKASLVALIFMHLSDEKKIIYGFLGITALFFGVMIFLTLTGEADTLGEESVAVQMANAEIITQLRESEHGSVTHAGDSSTSDVAAHTNDSFQLTATQARGDSVIRGHVVLAGQVPKVRNVDMASAQGCLEIHGGNPKSETLVLGENRTIGNVLVRVKRGLPDNASYNPPLEIAEIDQYGCVYKPHVLAIQTGQSIRFTNSDVVPHNVHTLSEANKAFNKAVTTGKFLEYIYDQAELFFVKCDIHPWMKSWVHVLDHPFFSVTKEDGKFEITGLPAGKFELEFWHEKLGASHQVVSVVAGEAMELAYQFSKE